MFLNRIILHDFKNIAEADVTFSPKVNCIHGSNGAGKTNLLDAVYYLSMTKSYFSASDQYVYAHGSEEATLCGFYQMDNGTEEKISAAVRRGGEKSFRRGAKAYARFSEHVGLLPVVMVSPLDSGLINDAGEERRKYLNFILSQTDRAYLQHIQAYNQLLLQRNRLLKEDRAPALLLDTITERMAPHAAYVHDSRRELCGRLRPMVQAFYSKLSQGRESVDLSYRSELDGMTLEELFAREADKEHVLHYTTAGIQRDDLLFRLDGHPLRRCGSQGQQKSFLLAMKLAQFRFVREIYGQTPLLLLDDVFDKLDMQRVEDLLALVSTLDFGQIFLTDSNKVRLDHVARRIDAPCRNFYVESGNISAE
ncbi:MAG: DNA replication and repair protein RecF [Bacteroidales bacterium]|nr:DNA replication and repair protein RecF [Bacteroidales bacterium]MBR0223854.1 DNA replication and repair protein RecF [Bacteroidales bacterium]